MNEDFVILLAEDDVNDALLVERALLRADIHNPGSSGISGGFSVGRDGPRGCGRKGEKCSPSVRPQGGAS